MAKTYALELTGEQILNLAELVRRVAADSIAVRAVPMSTVNRLFEFVDRLPDPDETDQEAWLAKYYPPSDGTSGQTADHETPTVEGDPAC